MKLLRAHSEIPQSPERTVVNSPSADGREPLENSRRFAANSLLKYPHFAVRKQKTARFAVWELKFLWSLGFGSWSFSS